MTSTPKRLQIAVHKFSSCDGCQLAFLNLGEALLDLSQRMDIVHFAEAGMLAEMAQVDIAFVEGSISTQADLTRIQKIREQSHYLVTIGACATSGGLQALRNLADSGQWMQAVYTHPEYIDSLEKVSPVAEHVRVDFELWGCPINKRQLLTLINTLSLGVLPPVEQDKLCLECKRQLQVCVMVTQSMACMGPVTRNGCGALCPSFGRDCYSCYGPAENANPESLGQWFVGLGLLPDQIANRFLGIHSHTETFNPVGQHWKNKP